MLVFPEGRAAPLFGEVRPGAGTWLGSLAVPVVPVGVTRSDDGWRVAIGEPVRWAARADLRDVQLGLAIAELLPPEVAPRWQDLLGRFRSAHAHLRDGAVTVFGPARWASIPFGLEDAMNLTQLRRPMRRAFRREVLLSCQVVRERDFRLVGDLAFELSPEGMLVSTQLPILTGEDLLVSFRGPRSREWFDWQASVARVIHGRRPSDRGRCLGLTFHDENDGSRELLAHILRGLPAPEPARGWPHALS